MKNVNYYLIKENIVAMKKEDDIAEYVFKNGKWETNTDHTIFRYLKGIDLRPVTDQPRDIAEDEEVVKSIREISYEEAMERITDQTIEFLKAKWEKEYSQRKAKWDKNPGWYAKLVETDFILNGIPRALYASSLGYDKEMYDEGFFESIQKELEKDLESYGATITGSYGFMD